MNIKYFMGVKTIEELKQAYRKLAKKYHPDLNKDKDTTPIMKAINTEYDHLFQLLKDSKTEKQGHKNDGDFKDVINAIIKHESINIDIIGSWVWVYADYNTMKTIKHELKELGFKWSGSNKKWYWTESELKKRKKATSYAYKVEKYGKKTVQKAKDSKKLA